MFFLFLFLTSSDNKIHDLNDIVVPYYIKIAPANFPFEIYELSNFNFRNFKNTIQKKYRLKKSLIYHILGFNPKDIGLRLKFGTNLGKTKIGEIDFENELIKKVNYAIDKKSVIKFVIDKLSCFCKIGKKDNNQNNYYIFSHYYFKIFYKMNRIIDVKIIGKKPLKIEEGNSISIYYSCFWIESNDKNENSFIDDGINDELFSSKYPKYAFINSVVLTLLFTILILFLLNRTFIKDNNEYQQYADFDGFELERYYENGWKAIHSNVFRPPKNVFLISTLSGIGIHLYIFLFLLSLFTYFGNISTRFDYIFKYGILIFLISTPFSSFISVTLGKAFSYQKWLKLSIVSGTVFPLSLSILLICFSFLWKISKYMIICFIIIALLAIPLSIFGGIIAMKLKLFEGNKCEVSLIPRKISKHPWYLQKKFSFPIVGFVCFISISVEIYYMFYSIMNNKTFYLYLFTSLILLILITSSTTFLMIYIYLQNEDYHWQWKSFLAPSLTGPFIFLYSNIFLNTDSTNPTRNIYYTLENLIYSLAMSAVSGGVGYFLTSIFVHKIYNELKLD